MNRSVALLLALLSAGWTGCYSMYPTYGPMGGYPAAPAAPVYPGGYPGAPIQTLTPGGSYVPNGSAIPGGTTPTFQQPGGGLYPVPDPHSSGGSGGNAPFYGNPGSTVPSPYSPGHDGLNSTQFQPPVSGGYASVQPATHHEPQPLPSVNAAREVRSPPPSDPFGNSWDAPPPNYNPPPGSAAAIATPRGVPAGSEFVAPLQQPAPPPQAAPLFQLDRSDAYANKISAVGGSEFAHDPEFKWVRGVVCQEPQDGSWSIIYSDNPEAADPLAGHLSLAPSPHLRNLREGAIVEIEGAVDPLARDGAGKPMYVVSQLRLAP